MITSVFSKALEEHISVSRIIAKIEGQQSGPTVVFFGGLHGNEAAGVFALQKTLQQLDRTKVKGNVVAISGNLKALQAGQRFIKEDLNRLWTADILKALNGKTQLTNEQIELFEIYSILKEILDTYKPPFYFIDLHTTSSKTLPFITINDSLINRKFSQQFPVPIVLGIEEYLTGPLLSYINKLGYVSLGFESGQHDDINAIKNACAFIKLALVSARVVDDKEFKDLEQEYTQLKNQAKCVKDVLEVIHLHRILNGADFKMEPGFKSFQSVKKGESLAMHDGQKITAPKSAKLFMPLYQKRGKEGFFLIRRIHPFFLKLSAVLRNIKADNLLVLLPGVSWLDKKKGVLQVNLKVAKFMVKPIFHLLGYRNRILDDTHIILYNRERVSKTETYKNVGWLNNF